MSESNEVEFDKKKFNELYDAVDARFPNAKFRPSCFRTIEEIETKIVCDKDEIIYADRYLIDGEEYDDYFIVRKKPNQEHIYYKDIIDLLIEKEFVRDDCNFRYLERIGKCSRKKRNENSVQTYASFWGS